MKKIAIAEINWLKSTYLNYGEMRISPLLIFNKKNNNDNVFSAIILNKKCISENVTLSYISFASPKAPYNYLKELETFDLYDGKNKIGNGTIQKVFESDFLINNNKWSVKNDLLD